MPHLLLPWECLDTPPHLITPATLYIHPWEHTILHTHCTSRPAILDFPFHTCLCLLLGGRTASAWEDLPLPVLRGSYHARTLTCNLTTWMPGFSTYLHFTVLTMPLGWEDVHFTGLTCHWWCHLHTSPGTFFLPPPACTCGCLMHTLHTPSMEPLGLTWVHVPRSNYVQPHAHVIIITMPAAPTASQAGSFNSSVAMPATCPPSLLPVSLPCRFTTAVGSFLTRLPLTPHLPTVWITSPAMIFCWDSTGNSGLCLTLYTLHHLHFHSATTMPSGCLTCLPPPPHHAFLSDHITAALCLPLPPLPVPPAWITWVLLGSSSCCLTSLQAFYHRLTASGAWAGAAVACLMWGPSADLIRWTTCARHSCKTRSGHFYLMKDYAIYAVAHASCKPGADLKPRYSMAYHQERRQLPLLLKSRQAAYYRRAPSEAI